MRIVLLMAMLSLMLSASLLDFKDLNEAKEAYSKKEYAKAEKLYGKVENDQAKFNQADALYRQKKYKEAISDYEQIKEPSLEAKKLHNIGNAYANMNKIDEAIKAYEEALKIAKDEDTKFNLEFLKKKKKEQEKKQNKKNDKKKNDKKNQDKKNKNSKDNDKKQDQKNDPKKGDKKEDKKSQSKKSQEQKKAQKAKDKKEKEKKMQQAKMADQNQTQPPISNMEERKWQKMLNQRGINTLMVPLKQGEKRNETNPW